MMMKEHITDNYGEIKYTMGNGCSGGSIGQNTVSSIYPGLLDGIQVQCDYSDSITTGIEVADCVLLVNFYAGAAWHDADDDRRHDAGADQRQEDGHQRPHRPDELPRLEQLVRLQQQAGQLLAAGRRRQQPAPSCRRRARDQQLQAAGERWSTTR